MDKKNRIEQLLGWLDEALIDQSATQRKIRKILNELFRINSRP